MGFTGNYNNYFILLIKLLLDEMINLQIVYKTKPIDRSVHNIAIKRMQICNWNKILFSVVLEIFSNMPKALNGVYKRFLVKINVCCSISLSCTRVVRHWHGRGEASITMHKWLHGLAQQAVFMTCYFTWGCCDNMLSRTTAEFIMHFPLATSNKILWSCCK